MRDERRDAEITPSDEPTYFDGSVWEDGRPVMAFAVDDVAFAARARRLVEAPAICHVCRTAVEESTSSGLLMWSRDNEVRFEEPPLCRTCATSIRSAAWIRWSGAMMD